MIKFKVSFSSQILVIALMTLFMASCEDEQDSNMITEPVAGELQVSCATNPSGFAPLSALLSVSSDVEVNLEVIVKGKHGEKSDFKITKSNNAKSHLVDIHGLYADFENELEIIAKDAVGNTIATETQMVSTPPLIDDMPATEVLQENLDENHPVFYLVNYFGFAESNVPHRPFLVDQFGDIRWYLNFQEDDLLRNIYMDNGAFHMRNNDMVFGGTWWDVIFITDLFGNIKKTISLGDHTFHHSVIEKSDGNLLLTASRKSWPTVQDIILEINPITESIVNSWDLSESLDNKRTTWTSDESDWIHVNGVAYDETDNTIIISGRTQGVVKLNYDNEVQWILAPHKDWATAGNGDDLNALLLQPLDQNGQPISNQEVMDGNENTEDFEWTWYQHSPILLPNGNFMCFDNGINRNFNGTSTPYSRAVEYTINQEDMTIQQVWDYGNELGVKGYSHIVSKVDYVPETDQVVFSPGAVTQNGPAHGRIFEVDKPNKNLKLDMKITAPQDFFGITFHNAQRFEFNSN